MGFWLLVPGVGMGGGAPATVIDGPFCVCATDYYTAGAVAAAFHNAGAVASDVHNAGAVASQGDCC